MSREDRALLTMGTGGALLIVMILTGVSSPLTLIIGSVLFVLLMLSAARSGSG